MSESHFYPRPPRGGRRRATRHLTRARPFLSTSPARGTTTYFLPLFGSVEISIHVPREGDDRPVFFPLLSTSVFLSTSPARGTTANVTENTLYFPVTFVTTRYSVQKHAAFLCRMRLFPQRTRTNTLKMITDSRCEPSGVFLRTAGSHPRLATRGGRFCADAPTPAKYRPAPIAARGRRVRPWPCTGCRAGKNAGCPHPGL